MAPSITALRAALLAAAASTALTAVASASQVGARPQRVLAGPPPLCIQDVRIGRGEDAERATLLLRDGRIVERLPAEAEVPPGYVAIAGDGLIALPAFVDAFTTRGVDMRRPGGDGDRPHDPRSDVLVDMRPGSRRGLQPSFRAVDAASLSNEHLAAWRAAGFGYALQSPSGEFLSGQGALVSLRDAALRERVVAPRASHHASFASTGSGYPSTLMGFFAHVRQFAIDAAHRADLEERRREGRPGPRPHHDPDLEAMAELARGDALVLCEAESATDVRRWLRFAVERGWRVAVLGGRDSGKEAERLAAARVPVVLTLVWGDEVDDPRPKKEEPEEQKRRPRGEAKPPPEEESEEPEGTEEAEEGSDDEPSQAEGKSPRSAYREPYAVRLARRVEWEERRDSAIALANAGVPFAFGTVDSDPADLLGRIRKLVKAGLDAEAALAALTERAAGLFGERSLGRLDVGADASLALWSKDPLTEDDARVEWLVVEGHPWRAAPKKDDAPQKEGR